MVGLEAILIAKLAEEFQLVSKLDVEFRNYEVLAWQPGHSVLDINFATFGGNLNLKEHVCR